MVNTGLNCMAEYNNYSSEFAKQEAVDLIKSQIEKRQKFESTEAKKAYENEVKKFRAKCKSAGVPRYVYNG